MYKEFSHPLKPATSILHGIASMAFSGIQGHKLEIGVVECIQLKDTWTGQHKPFVLLQYGTTDLQTLACIDGGKNPTYKEKFELSLIEGLHEITVTVCNAHSILNSIIGLGKVDIKKVLQEEYDIILVPLKSLSGRKAGEVSLILHYPNAKLLQPGASSSSDAQLLQPAPPSDTTTSHQQLRETIRPDIFGRLKAYDKFDILGRIK